MSVIDQEGPSNWKDVVKDMNVEEFKRDPIAFLDRCGGVRSRVAAEQVSPLLRDVDGSTSEGKKLMRSSLKCKIRQRIPALQA